MITSPFSALSTPNLEVHFFEKLLLPNCFNSVSAMRRIAAHSYFLFFSSIQFQVMERICKILFFCSWMGRSRPPHWIGDKEHGTHPGRRPAVWCFGT
jgi:hypothetical protein